MATSWPRSATAKIVWLSGITRFGGGSVRQMSLGTRTCTMVLRPQLGNHSVESLVSNPAAGDTWEQDLVAPLPVTWWCRDSAASGVLCVPDRDLRLVGGAVLGQGTSAW